MKILGLCHDVLICSAAVIVDGRVVSAVAEERLDRVKQSRVFPERAIASCLSQAKLTLGEIDEIAVGWNPSIELETIPSGFLGARRWRTEHLSQIPARIQRAMNAGPSSEMTVTGAGPGSPPITFVNHYDAHVGNALFTSDFDEAAVLVLDGRAERQTALLAHAKGIDVKSLVEVDFPHSLGLFYGTITQFLGFKPDGDEWKVMALGSAAKAENEFTARLRKLIHVHEDGRFELDLGYFDFFNFFSRPMYSDRFVREFGAPRKKDDPLGAEHERMSAAMQQVFEESVTKILHALQRQTGVKKLVASGGCFMNSVYNGKITNVTPFEECFLTSCPDDSGTSVGAALWLHAQRTKKRPLEAIRHNYWGPSFTDAECLDAVERYKVPNHEVCSDPSARAAADLDEGKIIGWFQGPIEFGQRALGNRSILLDPRRPDGRDIVNAAVKFRESFRPFAPAILAEHVSEWFDCEPGTKVPFMERVLQFRTDKAKLVPSVVHTDGSGRLQTVDEDSSPRYHALIRAFEKRTGVPIVLNTSFNLNGEPIVCSPEDAIRTFFTCGLDVLYLGNVRVAK